jgi:hypothetical protein
MSVLYCMTTSHAEHGEGSGSAGLIGQDVHFSRYACYLIVENADNR